MAKPKIKPDTNSTVSFQSSGPIRDENNRFITNDHSIYHDVDGEGVWLHTEKHDYDGKHVHIPYSHAVDLNLIPNEDEENLPVQEPKPSPAPTQTTLSQGVSGHKADDYKKADDKPSAKK